MTKKSNNFMKSALVTVTILALLVFGNAAELPGNTVLFNVTYFNGNSVVTLNQSNPAGTLLGGSVAALNFTIKDTANTTVFYNVSFTSTTEGFLLPSLPGNVTNSTFSTTPTLSGGNSSGYVKISNVSVNSGTETFINITNIAVPRIMNNSVPNKLIINLTVGTNGESYGYAAGTPAQISITLVFDVVSGVNVANSNLANISVSKVADNTDKFEMLLTARDANNNAIKDASFNLISNRAQDTIIPASVTTDDTGQARFNVTSTKAGLAKITANGTNLGFANLTNSSVVFVAGTANKLVFFGPNSAAGTTATTPGTTTQTIAVQDKFGNNVTGGIPATLITLTKTGSATFPGGNTLTITDTNINSFKTALGINTEGIFNSNFVVNDTVVETVTIGASPNATFSAIYKNIQYFGSVTKLAVTLSKSTLYANNSDSLVATAQLQDASNNSITTAGISVTLTANNASLLTIASPTNTTDANGQAFFTVRANAIADSTYLTAIDTGGNNGNSPTVTLNQAPSLAKSAVVNTTSGVIQTGENSTITATIKDYNGAGVAISGKSVTFNITTGDAAFTDGSKLKAVNTGSDGNASVNITSTNASTSISVNVTIVDEAGVTKQVGSLQNFTVTPSAASQFAINPSKSVGLKNVPGTSQQFTIQTKDSVGNSNTTASGTINITTSNTALGNMSNGTSTVNNNLAVQISGGNASFTYTVNSTAEGTAVLTLNSSLGIVDTITITTSGAKGISLTVNKTVPLVGSEVLASAQLTDASGKALGISGTNINFVVKNAENVIQNVGTNVTNGSGIAIFNFTQSVAGEYTVTASNASIGLSNSTAVIFAGPAARVVVRVNSTLIEVNHTILVNSTVHDANGVKTSTIDTAVTGKNMLFLADGIPFASVNIVNGMADTTFTGTTPGSITITAFYNSTLQNSTNVVVIPGPSLDITASESNVILLTPTNVTFTVTTTDIITRETLPVANATVTLSGNATGSGITNATGRVTLSVNATGLGAITATANKTGFTEGTTSLTSVLGILSISSSESSVLVLTPTNVTFTVTDTVTGQPVPGAIVVVNGAGVLTGNITNANGSATVIVNATSAGTITAAATKTNFASATTSLSAVTGTLSISATPTTVTVLMPTNVTFTVTSAGAAVNNATVILSGNATGSGTTDANGSAVISVNATGAGTITATAIKSGFASGTTSLTAVVLGTLSISATPTTVTVLMPTNVTFNVTSAGAAVSGAAVTLSGNATGSGTTDASGIAVISVNATGAGTITATASLAGYTDGSTTITAVAAAIGNTTVGVYRDGMFYLRNSNDAGIADLAFGYGEAGEAGDIPVAGDWNGDGVVTPGVYRNGVFFLRNSNDAGIADLAFGYGAAGDTPVVGDWNGDGTATIGVYRNGVFFLRNSNDAGIADLAFGYGEAGEAGDIPVAGDWNGDGTATIGVYRNGVFFLRNSNDAGIADLAFGYGAEGDTPVVGDWDGNGNATVGVYRNGVFYLRNTNDAGIADLAFGYGAAGDTPVVGDWDGQ
jgi:hypothetical protein